jgi:hypothetical protein
MTADRATTKPAISKNRNRREDFAASLIWLSPLIEISAFAILPITFVQPSTYTPKEQVTD